MQSSYYVGTAAWAIPKDLKPLFPESGITPSHLGRYSQVANAVEINTSFYRNHHGRYYKKWASETPSGFRFSVKLNRVLTHDKRLLDCEINLREVLPPIFELGDKLGCILAQLPPSLEYDEKNARSFFEHFRALYNGPIAIEPRHTTWISSLPMLNDHRVAVVRADPLSKFQLKESQYGNQEIYYCRLHGSPEIYKSDYSIDNIRNYFALMKNSASRQKWCVFDNTTFGHATSNAIELLKMIEHENSGT